MPFLRWGIKGEIKRVARCFEVIQAQRSLSIWQSSLGFGFGDWGKQMPWPTDKEPCKVQELNPPGANYEFAA
jgi:hypothetical protein